MVAGNETDVLARTQSLKPSARDLEFGWKADIGDIASHRNMARGLAFDVRDDMPKRRHVVNAGPTSGPVQIAGNAFANQLAPARARQRPYMRVGQMGETKNHGRH